MTFRNFLTAVLLVATFFPSYAQNQDAKAKTAIAQLASNIRGYKNMRIEFVYKMDNDESKIHESKQGTLLVQGEKYRLNIAGQMVINDGKALFAYLPEAKEVQINPLDEESQSLTPTGILADYEKKYRVKYIREEKMGVRSVLVADLIPNEGKKFFKVRIKLDSRNHQPISFAMYEKGGNVFTYDLNRLDTDVQMKPGMFEFKTSDYPGVEVVDMR
ncbi:MAG: outer membrane lipoprotein carrier protein LolA [Bacteroidales bacterium]|nr:outer membrane lipoprotein carrier protein LolA [Bacteroidales bacterium]